MPAKPPVVVHLSGRLLKNVKLSGTLEQPVLVCENT